MTKLLKLLSTNLSLLPMYDPKENTTDDELPDKNSERTGDSRGKNLETENQATPPPFLYW